MKKTLVMVFAMLAALLPASSAVAAPAIGFLNPSDYSGPAPFELSNKTDQAAAIHLVAWVKEVPASPLVEFEIENATRTASATLDTARAGTDAWEAFWVPPDSFTDGPYTLRAILYNGSGGSASEVASTEVPVVLNTDAVPPPPAPETVEITAPDNGDPLGFFTPKGKQPAAVLDYVASELTRQVRALYTSSAPGTDPEWVACGSAGVPQALAGRVRCTLKAGVNPAGVTAVAVVANMTAPQTDPAAQLDETGDAHRVFPYTAVPTSIEFSPEAAQVDDLTKCFDRITAQMLDQRSRPIAGANIDIHAIGPTDQLTFGSIGTGSSARTSPFQAPDSSHPSSESALRCSDGERVGRQGDHNVPLEDDIKHIESVSGTEMNHGTDTNGEFHFSLKTDAAGPTQIVGWADLNDDDVQASSEASGGARIGWAQPPPPPVTELALSPAESTASTGSCTTLEVLARRGGSALSGVNVDVHLTGPDADVAFCDVDGGSADRDPDAGEHSTGAHSDGTKHAEGETDSTGKFVFGVTSPTQGQTSVQAWLDSADDDVMSGELQRSATVSWSPPGDRSITLQSNKSSVRKGRRVVLSGRIEGDQACASGQSVNVQAKPLRGGSFQTVKTVSTDSDGAYSTRVRMRSARRFRATVPAADPCSAATSRRITVRTR